MDFLLWIPSGRVVSTFLFTHNACVVFTFKNLFTFTNPVHVHKDDRTRLQNTMLMWPSSARELRPADGTCAVCARPVERALACVDTSTGELLCPVHFRERHFKKVFAQRRVERWSRPAPPEERNFAGLRKLSSDQLTDERLRWAKWRRFVSKRLALRSALESAAEWWLRRNLQKLRAFRSVDRLVIRADVHRVSRCFSTLRCLALWHALSTQEAQRLRWCAACKRAVHRWIAACRLVLLNGIERHVGASLYRIHSCRGALRRLRAHARVRKLEERRLAPALAALYMRRLLPAWSQWCEKAHPFMKLRESLESLPTSPSGSAVVERRHPRSTLPTDGLAIAARRLLGEELREGAVVRESAVVSRLIGEELREGAHDSREIGAEMDAEILEAAELARSALETLEAAEARAEIGAEIGAEIRSRETLEGAEARTAVLASRSAELASLEDLASQLASRSAELAKTQAALLQADREKHAARRDRDVLLDTLSTLMVSAPNAQHGAPPVGPPVTRTMTTPAMKTPAVQTPAVKAPAAWSPALLPRPATTVGTVTLSAGALPPPAPPPPPALLPHPSMPVRSQRRRVTILPQMPDEGGHPMSEAIRRNQTQSDAILPQMLDEGGHLMSEAIRRNQTQSDAILPQMLPQMLPSELPTPKLPPPSELDPRPTITPQRRRITIIS